MRITIKLLILFTLFNPHLIDQCKGQTAAEVVFYHHRSVSNDTTPTQNDFPLYPVGDEVPNLPAQISKEETDLKLIQQYYNDVAKAFLAAAEQLEEKAGNDLEQMKMKKAQVSWTSLRSGGKGAFSKEVGDDNDPKKLDTHADRAQRLAANYKRYTYTNSLKDANKLRLLGEFYAELADHAQQLKEGIMQ